MHRRPVSFSRALTLLPLAALLTACGGGSDEAPSAAAQAEDAVAASADVALDQRRSALAAPTDSQRISAATATATSSSNACNAARPFYWEIGNGGARLAAGSVNSASTTTTYNASTPVALASASKWLYAAYVAQKRAGVMTATDVKQLTMRSGYTNMFSLCSATQSVDACLKQNGNDKYSANTDNRFFYNSGHMQKHASASMGLGTRDPKTLASEVQAQLGTDLALGYNQVTVAGGAYATPDAYARFLRKLMNNQLRLGTLLGSGKVCTSPGACGYTQALVSPQPLNWHYSLGHWVEDDSTGDGAFSSLGALGFYPWIDASRSHYGVLARMVEGGMDGSLQCGKLIRKAWMTGAAS